MRATRRGVEGLRQVQGFLYAIYGKRSGEDRTGSISPPQIRVTQEYGSDPEKEVVVSQGTVPESCLNNTVSVSKVSVSLVSSGDSHDPSETGSIVSELRENGQGKEQVPDGQKETKRVSFGKINTVIAGEDSEEDAGDGLSEVASLPEIGAADPLEEWLDDSLNEPDSPLFEHLKTAVEKWSMERTEKDKDEQTIKGSCSVLGGSETGCNPIVEREDQKRDNRNYIGVELGGTMVRALHDTGATTTLLSERVAQRCSDRIVPYEGTIGQVGKTTLVISGKLQVIMEIDGRKGRINIPVLSGMIYDMILGQDFVRIFKIKHDDEKGRWKAGYFGRWHEFLGSDGRGNGVVRAECAGLSTITVDEKEQVRRMAEEILPAPSESQGCTHLTTHRIELMAGAVPVRHAQRRMSPRMLQVAQEEVEKMRKAGIIEEAYDTEWRSAPVIVKKSDGSYRFCIDFRDLDKATKKDAYALPSIDEILDKLRIARYITKIDLQQAYFQVPMEVSSKALTAFAVPGSGLWQFIRMPFGLTNAPMTFQRLINRLFGPKMEPYVFGYLDDIIVVTKTFEDHLRWVKVVLDQIVGAGLVVNPKKCEFCCSQVRYLGYLLDEEGLRPDPEKIAPVLDFPAPRGLHPLRRFLGMVNWYSRFIDRDSELKLPLVKLLSKKRPYLWGEEQESAFNALKKALTEVPVLARPNFEREFTVQTDASDFAIGAVLAQEGDDGEHPIVFASRVLSSAERNYNTTEMECLAVLWAIRKFRPYLEGYHFTVVTDHAALKWLRTRPEPTGRLARWVLEFEQWDFSIVHRKGALHHVPDALSRGFDEVAVDVAAVAETNDPWYLAHR